MKARMRWLGRTAAAVVMVGGIFQGAAAQDARIAQTQGTAEQEARSPLSLAEKAGVQFDGVTPADALTLLRDRTGLRVVFSPSLLPDEPAITCACRDRSIRETFELILQGTGFTFVQVRDHVLIETEDGAPTSRESTKGGAQANPLEISMELSQPAPHPVTGLPRPTAAPTGIVTGRVVDAQSGIGLAGTEVGIPALDRGTLTDADGGYRIANVPSGAVTLRVERLGYSPVERTVQVTAGATVEVDFELTETAIRLPEVVAVGFGERTRRELSSSVSSVRGDRIVNQPLAGVDAALQGRAAGVQVIQNAGNPGTGITVRVRGSSSISAQNQPLWVIDGVPMMQEDFSQLGMGGQNLTAVTSLSPNEIESIDVLKDAAATAIFGSRGSNGVIMVRTKRGTAGAPQMTFNTYTGTQSASQRLSLLNSTEYLEYFNESATNDGYSEDYYGVIGVDDAIDTDWQRAILRSAPVHSIELSVGGSEGRFGYQFTGTYYDQTGIVRSSGYDRVNLRANMDLQASDRLEISGSLGLARERNIRVEGDASLRGVVPMAVAAQPHFPVRLEDGSFQGVGSGFPPQGLRYPNPVALAELNDFEALTWRALGNVEARYQLASDLSFHSRAAWDVLSMRENGFESAQVSGTFAASTGGVARTGYSSGDRYTVDNFLTYESQFGTRHDLSLTGGASVETNTRDWNFLRGEGFSNDYFQKVRNAANIIDGDATESEHNLVSFFSRANYALAGRYLATASLRTDGSSRFGPQNRWGVFPAGSVAWIVTEEDFLPAGEGLSELKLRMSYGLTGNQAIGNYPYQGLFGSSNYGSEAGLAPSSLENAELKWETTREFNAGVDVTLFDGRVNMTGDYYQKRTVDLLLNRPITGTSGFTNIFANVGEVENRGWEFFVSTVNVEAASPGGFEWVTDFNISANRNEVLALADDEPFNGGTRSVNRVEVGQPLGAFHMYRFLGVDPETGNAMHGDEREIVGSPHPDFIGGLANDLRWRGFDLHLALQFNYGNEIFNAMRLFSDSGGWFLDNPLRQAYEDRWREPGDETDVPRPSFAGTSGAREISSRFLEDGSYVRVQELRLGYELPTRLTGLMGAANARLYIAGHNLHTFTDYSGYSPDVNSGGSGANLSLSTDFYAYPQARTLTIGVSGSW